MVDIINLIKCGVFDLFLFYFFHLLLRKKSFKNASFSSNLGSDQYCFSGSSCFFISSLEMSSFLPFNHSLYSSSSFSYKKNVNGKIEKIRYLKTSTRWASLLGRILRRSSDSESESGTTALKLFFSSSCSSKNVRGGASSSPLILRFSSNISFRS